VAGAAGCGHGVGLAVDRGVGGRLGGEADGGCAAADLELLLGRGGGVVGVAGVGGGQGAGAGVVEDDVVVAGDLAGVLGVGGVVDGEGDRVAGAAGRGHGVGLAVDRGVGGRLGGE